MDDLFEQLKAAPPVNKNIVPKYATSDDYSKNIFRDEDDDTPPPNESTASPVLSTPKLRKSPNSSPPKSDSCIIRTRSFKVRIARIPKNWSLKIDRSVVTKTTNKEVLKSKSEKRASGLKIAYKSQEKETVINAKTLDYEADVIKDSLSNVSDYSKESLESKAVVNKSALEATAAVKKKSLAKERTGNKESLNIVSDDTPVINTKPMEIQIAANMEPLQSVSDNNKLMDAKAVANKKTRKSLEMVNPKPVETEKPDNNEPIKNKSDDTEKSLETKVDVKNAVETTTTDNNSLQGETVVRTQAVGTAAAGNVEVLKENSSNYRKPIGPKTALNKKGRSSAPSKRKPLEKESEVNKSSVETEEANRGEPLKSNSDDLVQSLEKEEPVNKSGLETLVDEGDEVNRKPVENKATDNMEPINNKSGSNQSSLEATAAVKRNAREIAKTNINTKPLATKEAGNERLENKSDDSGKTLGANEVADGNALGSSRAIKKKSLEKETVVKSKKSAETYETVYTEPIKIKAADDMDQTESNEGQNVGPIDFEAGANDKTLLATSAISDTEISGGVRQGTNNEPDSKPSVKPVQNLGKSDSKATPTKAQQKEFSPVTPIGRTKTENFVKPSNETTTKRCLVRLARANQWVNRVKSEQEKLEKTSQQENVRETSNQEKMEKTPKRKSAEGKGSQTAKRGRSSVSPTKPQTAFYIKLDTSPSKTLDSKKEKSPEKSRHINKGPKSKIRNKRESDGLTKSFKTSSPNKIKVTKFTRTQLIKTFGKRIFQLHVRIKRCRHPVMIDFDTIAQARKKSKKLSVSFRDQVEILGSTDTDDQSDEDNLKGISKIFNSKKLDTEDSSEIVSPTQLKKPENGKVIEEGNCDQSLLVNPNEVNTVGDISTTTSTPLIHPSPGQKRKDKKSFSPLKFETTPSPKKEQFKKANEKLPPSGLRLLNIDDIEDDDDDECEYIVPIELPERCKSHLNSIGVIEPTEQSELTAKAEDSFAKSDEQKSLESAIAEKHLINDTVIDVIDNASDDDGEKDGSVCIIEDDSDTEILPKLTRIPNSPNSLIPDSIPEIFSEKDKSDEGEMVAATKDETDDIIQNILKERIDDLSLDDYGVADSVEQDTT